MISNRLDLKKDLILKRNAFNDKYLPELDMRQMKSCK